MNRLKRLMLIAILTACWVACIAPASVSTQIPFAASLPAIEMPTRAMFEPLRADGNAPIAQDFSTNTPHAPTATPTPLPPLPTQRPRTSAPSATAIPPGAIATAIPPGTIVTVTPAPTAYGGGANVIANPTSLGNADPLAPTWTPPPPDPARQIADHYWLSRPASDDVANWAARTYPYGGTAGGRYQVHHGIDIVNPRGTRILAAADGTVIYAGDDLGARFGPINNYYGNLVVIQHNFTAPDGQPVFTLYGHMDRIVVGAGQVVSEGEAIGNVGATGVALGPHLHFEVRVGDPYSFDATRNPDLWIRPYFGYGTLAGRVTDAAGNLLYDVTLIIESPDSTRYAFSYADTSVNGDSVFGENYTMGDLPAGYYTVTVSDNGRIRFRETLYIYPNRTTWLNVPLNP
jgi:murein DD-endopeptidase MepM/ murein hydrolase activator NlpD